MGTRKFTFEQLREQAAEQVRLHRREVEEAEGRTDQVVLPPPLRGAKKGTTEYTAWAMECFLELLRFGYTYQAASLKLGMNPQWYQHTRKRHPEFGQQARAIREGKQVVSDDFDPTTQSFEEFVWNYFGVEFADHQKDIDATLQDPLAKLILILGHPESGKSTMISLWYPLWKLATEPDARIALVSKASSRAEDLLTRLKRYMTEHHLYEDTPRNLIEDFGGWKPVHGEREWSAKAIYIRQRKSGERDPSVQALGIGKQIYGARLDYLILDDALVLDNQVSELQRERIDAWFTNEARSRVQRGQTIVNGTRLFPFDLYGQWKKSWTGLPLFRGVYFPAILDEHTDDERPMWPEHWTLDGYDVIEEIDGEEVVVGYQQGLRDLREEISARDPARWKLVYQQEDIEESEAIFTTRHINNAFDLGSHRRIGQVMENEVLILGVDPATRGRAAAILMAVDIESRVRTVVDIEVASELGATGLRNRLIYKFLDKYTDNRISAVVIETNFAPTLFGDETFRSRIEAYGARLERHTTTARGRKRGSKWDEEYGIGAMAGLFSSGLIAFPSATAEDKSKLQPLIDDMITFPYSEIQDAVIALWVANGEAATTYRRNPINQSEIQQRRGVPPNIVNRQRRAG